MDRRSIVLAARIARAAGLFLMTAATTGGLFLGASGAVAVPWPHLRFPSIILGAVAQPTPSPDPSAHPQAHRGGPLTLSVTGSLTLGERLAQSDRTISQNQSTGNAGMMAQFGRRTSTTSLVLTVPAGVSGRLATFGEPQAEYSTPHYAWQYAPQLVSALGGLPMGGTIRGISLALPLRSGDVSFYGGPAFGLNNELLHVSGVRVRTLVRGQLVELGYSNAFAPSSGASVRSLLFGIAANTPKLNLLFETALQQSSSPASAKQPMRPSFSLRTDYGGGDSYYTVTLRHIAEAFTSLNSGLFQSEDFVSFGFRRASGANSLGIDESLGRAGSGINAQAIRRGTYSFGHQWRNGTVGQLALIEQRTASGAGNSWNGGAGLSLGFTIKQTSALINITGQRTVGTLANPIGLVAYSLQVQRPFMGTILRSGYQYSRQSTFGQVNSAQTTNLAVSKFFGKTALTFGVTYLRSIQPISDQRAFTPLFSVSRQISPAATVDLSFGETIVQDRINPQSNARSRVFNLTLSSPFAFGSGVVRGRSNPRLPATISGSVVEDLNPLLSTGSAISSGVGNVVVILDNTELQRTDLSGHFQFQFVKPGPHEVRVENASLPRGVTVDQPFAPITVEGGQDGQLYFRVGAYGAVQGHVYGRDASGTLSPLGNVSLQIDTQGTGASTTANGAFGFGRLGAGEHVVKLLTDSLPANLAFSGQTARKVVVRTGEIARLDFIADPLASIEGKVVYGSGLGSDQRGGVNNAYVVANPGDHAAITNDDGSFILDNLPAGTYTVDVDPETLPEETGVILGAGTMVDLKASEHHQGVVFTVGHKDKPVVFSLHQDVAPAELVLAQTTLPPFGATPVRVRTPFAATSVTVTAFGKPLSLAPDETHKNWTGIVVVPEGTPAGAAEITADVVGPRHSAASAALKVDTKMEIASVTIDPPHPQVGQYVRVRARILANAAPRDTILWADGSRTRLGRPISGRVYEFSIKVNLFPLRGQLLIGGSKLPIILK